ncbi:LysR family transcriptional regulator [Aeromonas crassostreae]
MKLSLDALMVLEAIEEYGSLTAAAEKLFKTPSALSYTVQKLENDLSLVLLDRSGHKMTFTENGRIVLEKGREVLDAARKIEQQIAYLKNFDASLTIGIDIAFPFHLLPPLLARFYEEFPHVNLTFAHEILDGVWTGLIESRFDIVLGALSKPPTVTHLAYQPLGHLEHIFVHAPTHPLARVSPPLSPQTIKGHRAITVGNARQDVKSDLLIHQGQAIIKVDSFAAKLDLLLAGIGCGYLPAHLAAPFVAEGKLISHAIDGRGICETAYIGWNCDKKEKFVLWWLNEITQLEALKCVYI